jgi:hypothetical protein
MGVLYTKIGENLSTRKGRNVCLKILLGGLSGKKAPRGGGTFFPAVALLRLKPSRFFHLVNLYLAPRRVDLFIHTASRGAELGAPQVFYLAYISAIGG